MKKKFTESQIVSAIKRQEAGMKTSEIARELGVSSTTINNWKSKYSGMEVSDIKRMKQLEAENAELKKMYAEMSIENRAIKAVLEKKF
jgi:putative transposase